jgi:hypothetical protein
LFDPAGPSKKRVKNILNAGKKGFTPEAQLDILTQLSVLIVKTLHL